jgi:hypothetical protein
MQKSNVRRREDLALVAAWARAVYDGRTLRGHVHPCDRGWLAERADGRILGTYAKEQLAVRAVLAAERAA